MFLFLDVASPIPEFHLINDKKIIDSFKILENNTVKLSDKIIPTYLEINNTHNLSKNLTNLIITIGPGSYTALRVGASFIAGLSQSISLPVSLISIQTIYNYIKCTDKEIGIYFESSNNQKFFSYKKRDHFINEKVENENLILPKFISSVFYNVKSPKIISDKITCESFSIKDIVLKMYNILEYDKNLIIKPIYISNNNILN